MRQAYEAKKWGFVPDYARLDIIYEHGGIYLDTDVEMVRSFDSLLENECFFGFEDTGDGDFFVNCGHGFGAVPHHEVIRQARDLYEHLSFTNADGSLNLLASPHYTTGDTDLQFACTLPQDIPHRKTTQNSPNRVHPSLFCKLGG